MAAGRKTRVNACQGGKLDSATGMVQAVQVLSFTSKTDFWCENERCFHWIDPSEGAFRVDPGRMSDPRVAGKGGVKRRGTAASLKDLVSDSHKAQKGVPYVGEQVMGSVLLS